MPVVTLKFMPNVLESKAYALACIGAHFQWAVARACSFKDDEGEHTLESSDVDFVPYEYQLGSIAAMLSIEIETYGFAGRKKKLNKTAMLALKADLMTAIQPHLTKGIDFNEEDRCLWMKYVDPDGEHI